VLLISGFICQRTQINGLTNRVAQATYESRAHAWMSLEQAKQGIQAGLQENVANLLGPKITASSGLTSAQKAVGVLATLDPTGHNWNPIILALGEAATTLDSIPTDGPIAQPERKKLSDILELVSEVAGALPATNPSDSSILVWNDALIDKATTKALAFSALSQ